MPIYTPNSGGGADTSSFYLLEGGTYNATINDLGKTIFTDIASDGWASITLPSFADAFAHGGTIKVSAARDYNDGWWSCISVYPQSDEWWPPRFLIGAQQMFSLYSTGVGDYLELAPFMMQGTPYWKVINFVGLWQDRD